MILSLGKSSSGRNRSAIPRVLIRYFWRISTPPLHFTIRITLYGGSWVSTAPYASQEILPHAIYPGTAKALSVGRKRLPIPIHKNSPGIRIPESICLGSEKNSAGICRSVHSHRSVASRKIWVKNNPCEYAQSGPTDASLWNNASEIFVYAHLARRNKRRLRPRH